MLLLKTLILLSSNILFGGVRGTSSEPTGGDQSGPKLDYKALFPPSSHVTRSERVKVANLLSQSVQATESSYHYWLLSHSPVLAVVTVRAEEILPPKLRNILGLPRGTVPSLNIAGRPEDVVLNNEMSIKVYEDLMLQLLQKSDTPADQYSKVLSVWAEQRNDKLVRFRGFANALTERHGEEEFSILMHELAYFLKLLSFETSFEALRVHKQQLDSPNVLVNTLGDSILDAGRSLEQFYKQFETTISTIGYLPKDVKAFEGVRDEEMAGTLRDIIGEFLAGGNHSPEKRTFMIKMWRAACTLHLSTNLQHDYRRGNSWKNMIAPVLYPAVEVGSTELFNSVYITSDEKEHEMLVEVQRTSDATYRVRQFNSGSGINANHKKWQRDPPSPQERYLSFVDMPGLSEDQIGEAGYYAVFGLDHEPAIRKLYANKHLAQCDTYTDPLLYERPQQGGTCVASSKMFYFRSFGLWGRLLEIDFKVSLIKSLLDRMDNLLKSKLSRTFLLDSARAEEEARFTHKKYEEEGIRKERGKMFKALGMEVADQYILLFPQMFTSLISSALNEILGSLYWIINNNRLDVAKPLFEHFLQETEPIFKSASPFAPVLLNNISPLVHDLHKKHFEDVVLPFEIPSGIAYKPVERPVAASAAILLKMAEILGNCLPPSKDKLPVCFYHIIDALFLFPHAPELALVNSELSKRLDFTDIPPELSYILLDAMRTVYGEDSWQNAKNIDQVIFCFELDWNYSVPEGSSTQDCEEYGYDDMTTDALGDLARCIYLRNGSITRTTLSDSIKAIEENCSNLIFKKVPACFHYIIKTLRTYPEAPELAAVTARIRMRVNFRNAPPELAFLIRDAMRSVFGEKLFDNEDQCAQVAFASDMPKTYRGDNTLLKNCEKATDDDIKQKWKWVAACRYEKNGFF